MTPKELVAVLASMTLSTDAFNPYAEVCPSHDLPDAPTRRRQNLESFLEAVLAAKAKTMWIAQDLGYYGGRRTGLPLTDEAHLQQANRLLGNITLQRATKGPLVAEITASTIWNEIRRINQPIVLWNIFPFHPHKEGRPLSNRCHRAAERKAAEPLLLELINMVNPEKIIAVGRRADKALKNLDFPANYVRHPAHGGKAEFITRIRALYGIPLRQLG